MKKHTLYIVLICCCFFGKVKGQVNNNQNSSSNYDKICKTWISFERTENIPMMHTHHTHLIEPNKIDSIIISKNGNFARYNNGINYTGFWQFNNDSSSILLNSVKEFVDNYRPDIKSVEIKELSDFTLAIRVVTGKEGESSVIKYRIAVVKP